MQGFRRQTRDRALWLCLPMDDCLAQVAIDFGGRSWLMWNAKFKRELIGKMPTEMFFHFFKSFADGAKANLNIKAEGTMSTTKSRRFLKVLPKPLKQRFSVILKN